MKTLNTFFLCCGRDDLLQKTVNSYIEKVVKVNTNFSFNFIIYDDSGNNNKQLCIQKIIDKELNKYKTKFVFSKKNLGQSSAVLKLLRSSELNNEDYVFFCEEDFEFVEDVSIQEMIDVWEQKSTNEIEIRQVVLLTDAYEKHEVSIEGLISAKKNIISYDSKYFILGTNKHKDICKIHFGAGSVNDDYCFHPHITKFKYLNVFDETHITHTSCGEDVIGLNGLNYCRLFIIDRTYANHIGDYRYYSVFQGARARSKTSSNIHSSVILKNLV